MDLRRAFQDTAKVTRDVKIEGIVPITLDPLPLEPGTELLGRSNQFDWNSLLAGADENDNVASFVQSRQIDLLHVLEINEQELVSQSDLARCGLGDETKG